jgi:hypothetical protein
MKSAYLRKIIKEEILSILKEDDFKFNDDTNRVSNRSTSYLFTVPNDSEGIEKIQKVKDSLSDIFTFRIRGRHHDRKEVLGTEYRPGRQNDVPVQQAEYLAVYVDPKK